VPGAQPVEVGQARSEAVDQGVRLAGRCRFRSPASPGIVAVTRGARSVLSQSTPSFAIPLPVCLVDEVMDRMPDIAGVVGV
jgi:hypothetical protein